MAARLNGCGDRFRTESGFGSESGARMQLRSWRKNSRIGRRGVEGRACERSSNSGSSVSVVVVDYRAAKQCPCGSTRFEEVAFGAARRTGPVQSQGSAISICALDASAYARLSKMKVRRFPTLLFFSLFAIAMAMSSCKKPSAISAEKAKLDVVALTKATHSDVAEVRSGLPQGAKFLLPLFATGKPASDDPHGARSALETARNKVQDLRVSKGTFFAVAGSDGVVIRNDQDQDAMAGHALFPSFPELKTALAGQYVESRGSMPEAAGVRGRADGQWVAAQPVVDESGVKGLYVTGWSWAAYARRLEFALGSTLRSQLSEGQKLPLVYVYIVVGKEVFGAPISPEVNARAIAQLSPLVNASASTATSFELEIDGREFGLGVELAPDLGKDVAVAVLRSET